MKSKNEHFSVPQELNHAVNLSTADTTSEKVASVDSLLQSFFDEQKVSNMGGFAAKGGNVVYHECLWLEGYRKPNPSTVDDYYILFRPRQLLWRS